MKNITMTEIRFDTTPQNVLASDKPKCTNENIKK